MGVLLLFAYAFSNAAGFEPSISQRAIVIKGTVTDDSGETLTGVTIQVKNSPICTIANGEGYYSIAVPEAASVLIFSFVGYSAVEETVGTRRVINVTLRENTKLLDGLMVTALGIVKKEESLSYSIQVVNGDELTRAKDPNFINTLAGKTAGVSILSNAAGMGGSVEVNIRGNHSVSGSNQPLYVVDGIPINGSANNLNPDDIESINILKGAAASALYGNSAANGVMVITTKKGEEGRTGITFNSNTTWENATHGRSEFQNNYIRINGSSDGLDRFFQTGLTTINSLALTTGTEGMQFYLSYANTHVKGTVENSSLNKHNFNFRQTANFFDKRLTTDANINVMYQNVKNSPSAGGYYTNPLMELYRFPHGDVAEGLINIQSGADERYRAIINLSLSFKINDYFDIKARGNADFIANNYELREINSQDNNLNAYSDAMLAYHQTAGDFEINATLGAAIQYARWKSMAADFHTNGRSEEQSAFLSGQLGWRKQLYLDVTGRNYWLSSLGGIRYEDREFFYPSVGLTWLLNETLNLPEWITLGKLRGAWSKVGNSLPPYNITTPSGELRPERTTAIEVGTEWRLWGSRLVFDFTYYKSNTRDQLFMLPATSESPYTINYVNASNVQNQGIEIMLSGSPVMTEEFTWKTGVNFATNKNKIVELHSEPGYFGNTSGDFNFGWNNTFNYKGFNLYFLVDGRFGGEYYLYDATNIRLRELSWGYSLPQSLFYNAHVIKGVELSLIGRNLFFFLNKAPYDPDTILLQGNGLQDIHAFGMPSTRSLGFHLKVNF
ncbi:MAG: TonB-dependent receptor [Mediterranea sp.]|jgi:TonB-dependent SusC/RagA subfamily outer membrane receptor|nr:TonB-dependent receptor [Mediterranea sp.]